MATKKQTRPTGGKKAPKKAAKPAPKAAAKKPVAKKTVKKSAPKPAPKKAAKPAPKPAVKAAAKPVAKKPAPKPAAKPAPKPAAKPAPKPVAKPAPAAKAPAPKAAAPAPVVKQEVPAPKPAAKKPGTVDPKSLVSVKPKVQPVIKKEPPKAGKVVIPKTTTKTSVKYEPEFTKSVLDITMQQHHQSGPTMRYSDSDLAEFREIIQRKLDAAKKELNYLQGLITRKDEGGDMDEARYMTMEDGSVSMEREQLSQMASRQITFIDHLEKAMMRIENKTYGICRVTGKLIDKARLRAVPHATLSIEAKQMMSK
ncbi:MAG: TraR/DksA family transcriptional regulator [Chitinophagales bacterium]|nr:TraR/DksA family transcriptional regulator [Chitinophagales bacterium]